MFENPEIEEDDLPALASVEWQPMHPSLRTQMLLRSSLTLVIIAAIVVAVHVVAGLPLAPPWLLVPVPLIVVATVLAWPFVAVPRRGYALRKHDIAYRSGVLTRKVTTIPFDRIQHVETSRGPLDRHYGTSTLNLFTAGGSKGDLGIDGMDSEVAEHVRGFILNRIDESSS